MNSAAADRNERTRGLVIFNGTNICISRHVREKGVILVVILQQYRKIALTNYP